MFRKLAGKKLTTLLFVALFVLFPIGFYISAKSSDYLSMSMLPLFYVWLDYVFFAVVGLLCASFAVYKFFSNREHVNKEMFLMMAKIGIVIYSIFLFSITISRYNQYVSEVIDVFYYHKVVWQISEFKIPLYSFLPPLFAWGDHFEPILFLIAPIYWLTQNAQILMIVQALTALSGAIPIYLIGKHFIKSRFLGIALGFSYLMFGGFQFGFAYGFHPIVLFPTIFLWFYFFYKKKQYVFYLLFLLLSLCVKEEVSFVMIFWGIYVLISKRDIKYALPPIFAGIFWYILCFHIIFPHFSNGGFVHWGQYGGGGLGGLANQLIFHPISFLTTLVTPNYKIDTIFHIFGSFGFLLLLAPQTLIIIIPSLMVKLLSSNLAGSNGAHYSAAITGVMVVSTFETVQYLLKKRKFGKIKISAPFICCYLIYVAVCSNLIFGYWGYSLFLKETKYSLPDLVIITMNETIETIPKKATVAAQYQIVPHMNKHYKDIDVWPQKNTKADYILLNAYFPPVLVQPEVMNSELEKLNKNKKYELIVNKNGTILFKKK